MLSTESRPGSRKGWCMAEHAVVVADGGPTGVMVAGELALAGTHVAIVERSEPSMSPGLRWSSGDVSPHSRRRRCATAL